jgi:hypothetical protein
VKTERGLALCGAVAVATVAFLLYRATLLPGLDFGDTASFQTVAGSAIVSPRDGYPLYFAIARAAIPTIGGDPAHALNLVTALESAAACGMLTLLATGLSGSVLAGIASALLFAVSYTFWSQSVIAEVYGLHMFCVCLSLWLLLRWHAQPTLTRLALFFAGYALGFGNHLSMILLLPAFTFFLLVSAPAGWRSMFRPRVIALATLIAAAGALQYAWNLRTLWYSPTPPHGLVSAIVSAWFDITKSDWRDTMVMNVPRVMLADHAAMYLFDLRQQFGWAGIAAAPIGLGVLWRLDWRRALLVAGVYLANVLFAYGYNVGDTHVFYLPSHLMLALLVAPALAGLGRAGVNRRAQACAALLVIAYAGVRLYADYPALDRSDDRRPTQTLARLTTGLDDRRAILLTDLNWQVQNGLGYLETRLHAGVASTRLADVLLYAPALVQDNAAIGREVVATARAAATLSRAFGPMVRTKVDPAGPGEGIAELTEGLAEGTPYVLCVLKPTRDFTLDADAVAHAIVDLTGGQLTSVPLGDYVAIGGLAGRPPTIIAASNSPVRRTADIGGTRVEIRMDSWLAADTIRRMGFGHVIADRRHSLIVERGVSFVAFDRTGAPLRSGYAAGIFGVEPRYLCYR